MAMRALCTAPALLSRGALADDQLATLAPEPSAVAPSFGYSVAIDVDTVVVGDPTADPGSGDAGGAWVFERSVGGLGAWGLTTRLTPGVVADRVEFGAVVEVLGDLAIVGDPGYVDPASSLACGGVFIFARDESGTDAWGQIARIVPSDPIAGAQFGSAIAVDGDVLVVGAPAALDGNGDASGAVYVFRRTAPTTWTEEDRISVDSMLGIERFGASVDVDDPLLVVGSPGRLSGFSEFNSGSFFVYDASAVFAATGTASFVEEVISDSRTENDYFGGVVRLDASSGVITGGVITRGATFRPTVNQFGWVQSAVLGGPVEPERNGVAIDGFTAVLRDTDEDVGVLEATDGALSVWQTAATLAPTGGAGANFGLSIDVDLQRVIVGDDSLGEAYVFILGSPADIDRDGDVDGADLAILLAAWGTAQPASDLNGDGNVDGADLAVMLAAWD
jgi:hypothetical protein